jgi:hypothetical protein
MGTTFCPVTLPLLTFLQTGNSSTGHVYGTPHGAYLYLEHGRPTIVACAPS